MRTVGYNSQRDNVDFGGTFKSWQQCFSTSVWMLLSYFTPEYQPNDDSALSKYVDDVCNLVGEKGIGEEVARKWKITGNAAYWWVVHQAAIKEWLEKAGLTCNVIFKDGNATWKELSEAVKKSPVIIGTYGLGGLPGGHIILIVDCDDKNIYVNDPYGDAITGYKTYTGAMRTYPIEWIKPKVGGESLRIMWVEQ